MYECPIIALWCKLSHVLILARYTEAIENIYARNTFVTVQLNTFLCFSGSILPQRLDIITSIWFAYHVESRRQPDRNPFSKIASSRRELPMWERTCSVLANMKYLCDLRMAVKAPSRYTLYRVKRSSRLWWQRSRCEPFSQTCHGHWIMRKGGVMCLTGSDSYLHHDHQKSTDQAWTLLNVTRVWVKPTFIDWEKADSAWLPFAASASFKQ